MKKKSPKRQFVGLQVTAEQPASIPGLGEVLLGFTVRKFTIAVCETGIENILRYITKMFSKICKASSDAYGRFKFNQPYNKEG